MKIKPELAQKLEAAKTVEEKVEVFSDVGIELTEEEVKKIAGGIVVKDWENPVIIPVMNPVDPL